MAVARELVTILILVDGFLQFVKQFLRGMGGGVTILILVDGFLQYVYIGNAFSTRMSHNPYFSRWFSAI